MEDEIYYIAHTISKYYNENIPLNKIKLTNIDESYYSTINRIFSLYNLKVNIPYKSPLSSYQIVKDFIKNYQEEDLSSALNKIPKDNKIYDSLISVINKYVKYNNKDLIIYKIKHAHITNDTYDNAIEIIDYMDYISKEDEYIFLTGFNDPIIPKNYMDTSYISDSICKYTLLDDTKTLNKKQINRIIKNLNDIKNLTITYKLSDYQKNYYPSQLCDNYHVEKISPQYNETYSALYDKIRLVKLYDNYYKYGSKDDMFDTLRNNYNVKYNAYSNKYTKINRIMDKLNLSYSSMQTYNKCAFRYYLKYILSLDIYEENFKATIGSMVHYVLEKTLSNNNLDIDYYLNSYLQNKTFTKKEYFFLEKYKESIHELLNQILLEKEYSIFNQALYEKKLDIDYGNNVHFIGIIDKVLYYIDNDTTYISLIDYKTGNDEISLKYLKYGLNIQLPIYLYLSTKLNFKNVKYTGFYLQKLNINTKDYRLIGYSNSNKETLLAMDKNYQNSKIIKGLKTNQDGSFSKNSKVLSDTEIENIKKEVSTIITSVIDKIKNNYFMINPKVIDGKNIGCEYCKFKDICFKEEDDEIKIDTSGIEGDS